MSNMILTNNQRKIHKLPLWRKKDKRKRHYTRCEAFEIIGAFLDWRNKSEKYKCIKTFLVETYDDNGFSTEKYMQIEEGSILEIDDSKFRMVGANDSIRLTNVDDNSWLEIYDNNLKAYFEKLN